MKLKKNINEENNKDKRSTDKEGITFSKILQYIILFILLLVIIYLVYIMFSNKDSSNPMVTFKLEGKGDIVIELYPDKAPNTVFNFITLVNSGYYNGKIVYGKDINTIHIGRDENGLDVSPTLSMIEDSIASGSDEDVPYEINGEFEANGFANDLRHEKYMVSMARKNYTTIIPELEKESYNSGSGTFNIVMGEHAPELDGKYAVFGKVVKGMEICDEIFQSDTNVPEDEENVWQLRRFPKDKRYKIVEATCTDRSKKSVEAHRRFEFEEYILNRLKEENKNGNTKSLDKSGNDKSEIEKTDITK